MARYRISDPAKADIAAILRRSEQLHGEDARRRYRACLAAAIRRIAADPLGRLTVDRAVIGSGLRSFHIRHAREESGEAHVSTPVHVIYFRRDTPDLVEIARVLHERMDPVRHLQPDDADDRT